MQKYLTQFNSIQFNSIQFKLFNSIQFICFHLTIYEYTKGVYSSGRANSKNILMNLD